MFDTHKTRTKNAINEWMKWINRKMDQQKPKYFFLFQYKLHESEYRIFICKWKYGDGKNWNDRDICLSAKITNNIISFTWNGNNFIEYPAIQKKI